MINNSINKPSLPRDASSVIIIKKKNNKLRVLMGRRPAKSKFMPGIYVFPGGAIDKTDYQINKLFNLSTKLEKGLLKSRSNKHTIAIMLAAIRETAEECGLFLAEKKIIKYENLNFNNTWNIFLEKSFVPSIQRLNYFGRAITPSFLKTRFHARFFIANFDDFIGRIKTNGELENIGWVEIKKAKLLPIADVTEFLINRLIELDNDKIIFKKNRLYPMFTRRNNKRWVKWDQ